MRLFMRCFGVLACLTLVLSGCSSYTGDISEWKAPVLSKDWKTVVELRSNVDFGDQVSDAFSTQKALTGFVFDAHQGARVTVTLDATNGDDPVLLLYGPLDGKGIWGKDGKHIVLDHDSKDGRNSVISDFALPEDGRYLIGADTRDGSEGGPLQLTMGCRGECDEPLCDDETLMCDLYCPNGFMTDPNGCPICQCVEECQTDEDCMLPWSDQIARCVDGQCIYEELACDADDQCPEGFICEIVCVGGGIACDPRRVPRRVRSHHRRVPAPQLRGPLRARGGGMPERRGLPRGVRLRVELLGMRSQLPRLHQRLRGPLRACAAARVRREHSLPARVRVHHGVLGARLRSRDRRVPPRLRSRHRRVRTDLPGILRPGSRVP